LDLSKIKKLLNEKRVPTGRPDKGEKPEPGGTEKGEKVKK
jgi:hypothetical protein